jgi:AcrR family transcriptional regulator
VEKSDNAVPLSTPAGTREAILDAARDLFAERGFAATSLRQIAEAVKTTKAAVYYHFPAKEHMLLELTRPMLDDMADLVASYRDDDALGDKPVIVLAAYLDLLLKHLPVIGVLARDPATQAHPDIGARARMLVDAVQQLLTGPEPTPEHATRAACALGVVHAVTILPPEQARSHRRIVLDAAVAALTPPAPTQLR